MKVPSTTPQDCKVVSVEGDQLTTTSSDGSKHCFTIAKDAKVTCNGQMSKSEDLKAGVQVRVTPCKDDKTLARTIESGKNINAMAGKV